MKGRLSALQTLATRIDARVKQLEMTSSIEEMRRDKLSAALKLLDTFVTNDIKALQKIVVGLK